MQFLFTHRGLVLPRTRAVPGCRCSPDGYFHTTTHRHSAFGAAVHQKAPAGHLSPTDTSSFTPQQCPYLSHYQLPPFTSKIFTLSPTDYLRFYHQNMNFIPDNYLDFTSIKIQWLHLPYPQIVHSGPKDSIGFFPQNTSFSLQTFAPKVFPATTDYLIFTSICPFSPLEIIASFSPKIFPSHPLLRQLWFYLNMLILSPTDQLRFYPQIFLFLSTPGYLNFTSKCSFSPLKFYPPNLFLSTHH